MTTLLRLDPEVLPGTLRTKRALTDEEFERICSMNRDLRIELTAEGEIRMHAPTGSTSGAANARIAKQIGIWWDTHKTGEIYDSSTGFKLKSGAVKSPDAAWMSQERFGKLTKRQKAKYPKVCPTFVIELLSVTDDLAETQAKMGEWIDNEVQIGWLINPYERSVTIYEPGKDPRKLVDLTVLKGSGAVESFTLNLDEVWSRYS